MQAVELASDFDSPINITPPTVSKSRNVNYPTLSEGASCFIHSPPEYVLQALRAVPALEVIQNLVTRRSFKHNAVHLHPLGRNLIAEGEIKTTITKDRIRFLAEILLPSKSY